MPEAPHISVLEARFVPAPEASSDLAVVLHGRGDSMAGFYWMPQMLALPRLNYLLLNAPDPFYTGYAWYGLEDIEPGVLRSRGLLQSTLGELEAQGWPSERTLLFGFSQGCLMSLDVALRHGKPLAGIVGISGYAFRPEHAAEEMHAQAREQAWLVTHGTHDDVLPIERTRSQIELLRAAGLRIEWHEYVKGHTIDPEDELPLLRRWIAARFDSTI